jgi:hypothetical protein
MMKAFLAGPAVVLIVLLFTKNAISDVTIELESFNETKTAYSDYTPFRMQYANVPNSQFKGLIHQPQPSNGCEYVSPLPKTAQNYSWIALIDNYTLCTKEMIDNVRNAGYQLILAYSSGNKRMTVDHDIRNSGFGVVIVSDNYAPVLYSGRVVDINDTSLDTAFVATISVFNITAPAMITSLFLLALFCCCWALCCFVLCCRRRSNQHLAGQVAEIEGRRRNFERVQRQERLARQELIESILRQLQELQVDLRLQVPLGDEETKKLPTRKYRKGEEKMEQCVICVEDFHDGEGLRVLPCEHYFHRQCIDEWLINHSAVCPLCKYEVPRSGGQGQGQGAAESRGRGREGRHPLLTDDDDETSPSLEAISPLILPPRINVRRNNSENAIRTHYGSV